MEENERLKKEADHLKLVGDRFIFFNLKKKFFFYQYDKRYYRI